MPSIRQPIVVVMGHVDHGKTSLLDRVRKTTVAKKEAGGITQHIGASEVPISVIKEICGPALQSMKIDLKIPGLLFIDTPGHEAFTNLRKRGGSIADIAVLVIDIAQGFQPQTLEAISILREYKTPFIVALNKIDLINGWRETNETSFSASFAQQRPDVQAKLDETIYSTIGRLYERGFEAERFDRVADHAKQLAIVPVSAKTGEGITELLMLLAGLSQRFLEQRLRAEVSGPGKGSILEVKEESGLGTTIDVILYDGTIHKNDLIVFATVDGGASAKVRSLLKPKPMREMMRDSKDKFDYVDEVGAASGVKISAPGLEGALAGSELFVVKEGEVEEAKQRLAQEVKEVLVERASAGVIVKADTLGSLEALTRLLEGEGILVKKAGIGMVGKRDVVDADAVAREDPLYGVILVFNSPVREDARQEAEARHIPIMHSTIIYTLIDDYKKWRDEQKKKEKEEAHRRLVMPAKIKVLEGHCFHASKPCIVGVEVLVGKIAPRVQLLNESGKVVGEISEIQKDGKPIGELKVGEQAAIALPGVVFDRGISYNEVLYSYVPKEHAREWREKYGELLAEDEKKVLEEIEALRG